MRLCAEIHWAGHARQSLLGNMMRKVLLFCSLAFALSVASAKAQEPTLLGEFNDWAAYTYTSQQGKVCYAVTMPKSSEPPGINRDPVFFLITHFPQQGV